MTKKTMLTCYDASFAKICADVEAFDYLLVGDSVGMVVYGAKTTLEVTLEDMERHAKAVVRGLQNSDAAKKPAVVVDLPVGTYKGVEEALQSATRLKNAGAEIIKVEGPVYEVVTALRERGFRVCGHIGLTPQSIQNYKVQGKSKEDAERLLQEAQLLEKAGCELLVLELIPSVLARQITDHLKIPSIGIGAGPYCDGQVLVLYDVLGFNPDFSPRFLKKYLDGYAQTKEALSKYAREVKDHQFPDSEHSF